MDWELVREGGQVDGALPTFTKRETLPVRDTGTWGYRRMLYATVYGGSGGRHGGTTLQARIPDPWSEGGIVPVACMGFAYLGNDGIM